MANQKYLDAQMKAVAVAEDILDLEQHVAWQDVLLPKLREHKAFYEKELVGAVLGQKPITVSGQLLTAEQLAGKVYGIDYIIALFTDILKRGEAALNQLNTIR